ncbi:MAG: UbiD family decarboxylase [Phycisphaeraceae bacterium]|nr:UbiD family decarboxylase [Phycisphaeraceae bacterium]
MYPNLGAFVAALDSKGEVARISRPVSPVLEVAAMADLESRRLAVGLPSESTRRNDPRFHHLGGQALLFENVDGSEFPLLINAWGSYRRMEMALGCDESNPGPSDRTLWQHAERRRFVADGARRVEHDASGFDPADAVSVGGFEAIAARIAELVKPEPPRSLLDAIAKARQFLPLLKTPPKRRKGRGECQQVELRHEQVDLTRLPIIRCWPHDGDFSALGYPANVNEGIPGLGRGADWDAKFRGRYITLAGVHTIHADDEGNPKPSSHNIGMYRVQLLGKNRLGMHWHMHHDGARHWRSWKAKGKPMPVAIVLGGESVLPYAATAPLPPGISELLLAGFLNGKGIPMVRARTVPLWIPANAEIVIEGYASADAGFINYDPRTDGPIGPGAVFEGPFGDHTGFYSLPDRYPIVEVTAVTHRRHAVYPTTVVGLPPQEDYFLGKATERIFLPLLKTLIPDIEDYDLPMFGAFHNCAFVKIKKHYPMHARRVMHAIWGAGQMSWTKSIFVVDHDVDIHDAEAVLRAAARNFEPARDLERVRGPLDILDHAAPRLGVGTKFGLDCTRKIDGEQAGRPTLSPPREAPNESPRNTLLALARSVSGVLDARLHADGWLLLRIDKRRAGDGYRALQALATLLDTHPRDPAVALHVPAITLALGPDVDIADADLSLFHWLAHSDAGRDARIVHAAGRSMLLFDATPKVPGDDANGEPVRDWPPILKMDPVVTERVRPWLPAR